MSSIIIGIIEEGLVYAILSFGIYITYSILDFPDLSVDGTYPLGAAVTAAMIAADMDPLITLPLAFLAGALAGIVTGLIHVKLRVRDLLSGIIVSTGLYSINLRIAGKSNLPIFSKDSIFSNSLVNSIFTGGLSIIAKMSILLVMVLILKLLLDAYLRTRSGYLLRAAGSNPRLVTALSKNVGFVKIVGLGLANGFAAFAGCVMAQKQGYFELSMGTGMMVIGLANVIIGTQLFGRLSFMKATTSVILGAIIYRACVAAAINAGMEAGDMKLITALLFLIILAIGNIRKERVRSLSAVGGHRDDIYKPGDAKKTFEGEGQDAQSQEHK